MNKLESLKYVCFVSGVTEQRAHFYLVRNSFDVEKAIAEIQHRRAIIRRAIKDEVFLNMSLWEQIIFAFK